MEIDGTAMARVSLIEAYNSVYNYDLIGTVETHLDDTIEVRNLDLTGYTFIKSNHPDNVKRGGVGLYVKDSFPAKSRQDLAILPECIVCEVRLDKKSISLQSFTVVPVRAKLNSRTS